MSDRVMYLATGAGMHRAVLGEQASAARLNVALADEPKGSNSVSTRLSQASRGATSGNGQMGHMTEVDLVALAEEIATRAHQGQVDKAGAPYIEHPRRVARRLLE